ncbi:MAG: DnaJ domain-containing protein [candidate division Zixibacteria bacterium]
MKKEPFDILGISKDASRGEIKSAFRRMAKRYHPDIVGGTGDKFKRILLAYEQIAGYVHGEGETVKDFDFEVNVNIDRKKQVQDLFDDFKDGILTYFDIGKPEFLNLFLELTPEQASQGGKIKINLPLTCKCKKCYGFGQIFFIRCKKCGGTGEEVYQKSTLLDFSGGVADDSTAKQHIDNLFLTVVFKIEDKAKDK